MSKDKVKPKTEEKGTSKKKGPKASETIPVMAQAIQELFGKLSLAIVRPEKRVKQLDQRLFILEKRFKNVLQRIYDYDGDNRDAHVRVLCKAALTGGTKPGSIQWSFTSRILDDPRITGFCKWCGINCYGESTKPEVMPCNVPGCPFENPREQQELTEAQLQRLMAPAVNTANEEMP